MRLAKVFNHQKLFEGASDYKAIIDNFPYKMIGGIYGKNEEDNLIGYFQNELSWAKTNLKRPDRIVWWLKFIKIAYYSAYIKHAQKFQTDQNVKVEPPPVPNFAKAMIAKNSEYENNFVIRSGDYNPIITRLRVDLEHYMGIDDPRIQNYHWLHETPQQLTDRFQAWEKEYQQREGRKLTPDASHTVILKMGEYVWLNLNKAGCSDEGKAGRHCGNTPRQHTNDRVLSLRRLHKGGKQEVCLTFVMEEDGYLGERKAFANHKPDPKYHPHILALLKQPFIKGMKGGRWAADNDFQIKDLSLELANDLFKVRPEFFHYPDLQRLFGKDDPALFEHALKIADRLTIPDVEELFAFFPEGKYKLADALGAANNREIDIFHDRFRWVHSDRSLVEHMVYNGLVGDKINVGNLKKYGFVVRDPVLHMLIKKVDQIQSEIEPPEEWSYISMFKATPRPLLMDFMMKAQFIPTPFSDYMKRFDPPEIETLLKKGIIHLTDYIQYFGKDSDKSFGKVLDVYKEKHSHAVGNGYNIVDHQFPGYELYRNAVNPEIWTALNSSASLQDLNIPRWYIENILTDEIIESIKNAEKKNNRGFNTDISKNEIINRLNNGHSRKFDLISTGEAFRIVWKKNLLKPELDISNRYKQFKKELDQVDIGIVIENATAVRVLKNHGAPASIPLKIKVDDQGKKSLIVEHKHLVDWYIFNRFFRWSDYVRYIVPKFDVSREEIETVIDYDADREGVMRYLKYLS